MAGHALQKSIAKLMPFKLGFSTNFEVWKLSLLNLLKQNELNLNHVLGVDDDHQDAPAGGEGQTAKKTYRGPVDERPVKKRWRRELEEGGDGSDQESTTEGAGDERAIDRLVLGIIHSNVEAGVLSHLYNCSTSREAWAKLQQLFSDLARFKIRCLRKKLISLRIDVSHTVEDFVSEIEAIRGHLLSLGHNLDDGWTIHQVLSKLPNDYQEKVNKALQQVDQEAPGPINLPKLYLALQIAETELII